MTPNLSAPPVHYEPSFEHEEQDEAKTTSELIETLRHIAEKTFEDTGHALRAVHAKNHGMVRGEMQVLDGLPPQLAQGLFAKPGTYPVVMRISTSPGDILDDRISTPRGLGLKIIGVEGERLPGSEGDATQDFVMVNGPAFLAPGPKKFLGNLKMLAATTDKAEGLKRVLSAALQGTEKVVEALGGKSPTLIGLGGHPETNPLGETYYTQVPVLYGPYMAKVSLAPVSPELLALKDAKVDLHDKPNGLRSAVSDFFAGHSGEWELRVQLCTDIKTMPLEDASVAWPEDKSPYLAVARIKVAAQASTSADAGQAADDRIAFSPWHGLAAHRPLGAVMRARKTVYDASASFRAAGNRCPIHEPTTDTTTV